jgi:hypothetical protein
LPFWIASSARRRISVSLLAQALHLVAVTLLLLCELFLLRTSPASARQLFHLLRERPSSASSWRAPLEIGSVETRREREDIGTRAARCVPRAPPGARELALASARLTLLTPELPLGRQLAIFCPACIGSTDLVGALDLARVADHAVTIVHPRTGSALVLRGAADHPAGR